jgi:NNP family nitrate/nitrite transporter-like MFS transporter
MVLRDFLRAGHLPSLASAFLYFDVSFMVWVLIGALANSIVPEFRLTPAAKGLLVATPILGGAVLRLVLGALTDRIGPRRTGLLGLTLTLVPLVLGWLWADSFPWLLLVGLLLGVAGASFAVALPLASRWYPPRFQGLALGIAGAGNSGTALATFFGPRLALYVGWHGVFGIALAPVLMTLLVFWLWAKDAPDQPAPRPWRDYWKVLAEGDTWWFSAFYAVTFGGFVGLASFLSSFFHDQYGLGPVAAGNFATLAVVAGSCLRPVGGHLADRWGGVRLLTVLFAGVGLALLGLGCAPSVTGAAALLFVGMGLLGMGNGAVFQLVPQRFPRELGVITGIVGAAGGMGGFFLPVLLGTLQGWLGSFREGFLMLAIIAFVASLAIRRASRSWNEARGTGAMEADKSPRPWLKEQTA